MRKIIKGSIYHLCSLRMFTSKNNTCKNNTEKPYTEKKAKNKPSGYSLVTCCSFGEFKNEIKHHRGKDCIKIFCKDFKDQAMRIIKSEKKKIIPLANEEREAYENQKNCYIYEK